MFNGFNLKDMGGMLGNMQGLQEKFKELQDDIATLQASGTGGLDDVTVTVNGQHHIVDIAINPQLLQDGDTAILQDYIKAATNKAINAVNVKKEEKTSSLLGGMPLPPGFKLPF